MISVILADDHDVVRCGIQLILEADPEIEVVNQAADGVEAYELVARDKPDILLLDISMPPGQSGTVACEKIAKSCPATKIIILTMFAEPEYLLYTLRGGCQRIRFEKFHARAVARSGAHSGGRRALYSPHDERAFSKAYCVD